MILILRKGASEEEMQLIKQKLHRKSGRAGVDVRKYSGTVKLKESPLAIQKKLRDEWR